MVDFFSLTQDILLKAHALFVPMLILFVSTLILFMSTLVLF